MKQLFKNQSLIRHQILNFRQRILNFGQTTNHFSRHYAYLSLSPNIYCPRPRSRHLNDMRE